MEKSLGMMVITGVVGLLPILAAYRFLPSGGNWLRAGLLADSSPIGGTGDSC